MAEFNGNRNQDFWKIIGIVVAICTLIGSGITAWATLKSEISVNQTKVEIMDKRLERIEIKLDHVLEGKH